jgi:hypothetical protein
VFAVVRHPDIDTPGIIPQAALEAHLAREWYRVSDWRAEPAAFHLPDFFDAPDVDAPEPEQEPDEAPAETTKEKTA